MDTITFALVLHLWFYLPCLTSRDKAAQYPLIDKAKPDLNSQSMNIFVMIYLNNNCDPPVVQANPSQWL